MSTDACNQIYRVVRTCGGSLLIASIFSMKQETMLIDEDEEAQEVLEVGREKRKYEIVI